MFSPLLDKDDTKQQFLVDTGAAVNILPHRSTAPATGPALAGADGKSIPSWGLVRRRLSFGLRNFFATFILAAVSRPILGLDFLANHCLVARLVLDAKTLHTHRHQPCCHIPPRSKFAASLCSIAPAVRSLLALFPAIVGDCKGTPTPRNGVRHTVETKGRPVFAKARRLDPDKLHAAEA